MAVSKDYYLNDNQYDRLISLLKFLSEDLIGEDKFEDAEETLRIFEYQRSLHLAAADSNIDYSDIACSLRKALNEWMEDVRKFPDDVTDEMEEIINGTMEKFLDRQEQMSEFQE
jgi:hypothetical protein|tara:strand:- start:633 stop:974 length:342 start_codon:yes stop_codon:yes gene_type:complete